MIKIQNSKRGDLLFLAILCFQVLHVYSTSLLLYPAASFSILCVICKGSF